MISRHVHVSRSGLGSYLLREAVEIANSELVLNSSPMSIPGGGGRNSEGRIPFKEGVGEIASEKFKTPPLK